MADFNPSPHDRVIIGGHAYTVMPHPAVPTFAFGQEGRKAFVYQINGGPDQGLYALKKFKEAFRLPELVDICDQLARFSAWPGLEVCARQCLNANKHGETLVAYPDLEYAVLMPWIGGSTWYDMVIGMTPLSRLEALTYANATAQVLAAIEEAGLAHCDISAANVIINPNTQHAHLIDVEDLYSPGFTPPASLPAGTDGYAHRTASNGLWGPAGDRFAGAVIIAEMAAWFRPEIRREAEEEHYFATDEMQQDVPRYQLMRGTLETVSPAIAELFDEAWFSPTLADAPPLKRWQEAISEIHQRESVARVAPEWRALTLPGADGAGQPTPAAPTPAPVAEAPVPTPTPEPDEQPVPEPAPPAPSAPVEEAEPGPEPALQPPPTILQPPQPVTSPPTPPPAQPLHVQPSPQTGGPVIEWRPLNLPQSTATPPPTPVETRPIWSPPAEEPAAEESVEENNSPEEPALPPEPVDEAEPAAATDALPDLAAEQPLEAYAAPEADYDDYGYEDGNDITAEEYSADDTATEAWAEEDFDDTEADDYDAAAYASPPPDRSEAWPGGVGYTAAEEAAEAGLFKPLLDLTHIDERNRPHLVWSESPGAVSYILQEDSDADFGDPREYHVRGHDDTQWSPPRLLWRRAGRLYYRVRAEADGLAGPWSDVLQVRIGRG